MNYQQFQKKLAEEVKALAPDTNEVKRGAIVKNNGIARDTLEIRREGSAIYPTIYTDQYYMAYQQGVPMRRLAGMVMEQCAAYGEANTLPDEMFADYDEAKQHIYCKLINAARNRDVLRDAPHRMWNDLAIVCYYAVEPEVLADASILVRREHLTMWGVGADQMLDAAWENTRRDFPAVFRPLSDALAEMRCSPEPVRSDAALYLLTNTNQCFGAVAICFPETGTRIAEQIQTDFFILPSSIHECLILGPAEDYNPEELNQMVREINATQLAHQEILSDHVYYFDRVMGRALICGVHEE